MLRVLSRRRGARAWRPIGERLLDGVWENFAFGVLGVLMDFHAC